MTATATRSGVASIPEAAAYLRKSRKTLRNWRSMGIGPKWVGSGRGVTYPWSELDRWIKQQTH